MKMLLLVIWLCTVAASSVVAPCTLTVTPGPHNALYTALPSDNGTTDVVVCLSPGTYSVANKPLAFLGGRTRRVTWRSAIPGAAIISGGTPLSSWQPVILGGGQAYVASVPASVGLARQLWVRGARANRTVDTNPASTLSGMTPWITPDNKTVGYTVGGRVPTTWMANNTRQIEFTWPIVIRNWISPRCTLASANATTITLVSPCGVFLTGGVVTPPVTVEAVPTFPLLPGTFYHDLAAGLLYYSIASGQTPADLTADAVVSGSEVLLDYTNTVLHTWQGVRFSHSTWRQPNSDDGMVDAQSIVYLCTAADGSRVQCEPLGSVRLAGSHDVSFLDCEFTHLGGGYAISAGAGSGRITISGCSFSDLSGGAVRIGNTDPTYANAKDGSTWDSSSALTDCTMSGMAIEYGGAAGVFAGYVFNLTISHNTISDAGYTGVSMGWGWGGTFPAGYGANLISYNRIARVMTKLRDGGGVYVNGAQNVSWPSVTSNNWVDSDEAVYAVYYLDNGASHWSFTQNVASSSLLAWAFFMQGCCNLPAGESHLDHIWYMNTLQPQNNCAAEGCTVDNLSVFPVPAGTPWPAAAQAIMDNSGARGKFYRL